ncbi:MAG: MotA/TolQ/ExbB proton channel family protein [Planctomycetota bacterium]
MYPKSIAALAASQPRLVEEALAQASQAMWWPVVGLILIVAGYTLVNLGACLAELGLRLSGTRTRFLITHGDPETVEELELIMMKELEGLRICSRVSPMLGLIATMIPLGPALSSVATEVDNVALGRLGDSFASVIVALVSASIAFGLHSVRRRWLLEELHARVVHVTTAGASNA